MFAREIMKDYLCGMKMIAVAALLILLGAGSMSAQDAPTSFRFNWESGEVSMDMHLEDNTWELNGRTLTFTETVSGRGENMPRTKSPFHPRVVLNQNQLAKLRNLLSGLVNERSFSLLPKDYQGSLLRYSLSFGTTRKEVSLEAPQIEVDKMDAANSPGSAPPPSTPPVGMLLFKLNELRDYLVKIST